jgi:predicted ATPase
MFHSLSVAQLRSMRQQIDIEFKPITLLLGANSSGKSTFLRFLPLLKQSTEARTTGPILWNGRLVDFGSFEEAVTYDTDAIYFGFSVDLPGGLQVSATSFL